ncbi:MAG: HAD family phosphatase [Polyangiaceae bacterium]|nr:HAD family phosphatase [Polyangiaceae bacterium]
MPSRFSPPQTTYQAYLFDCDGTLADSMPAHFQAWRRALNQSAAPFEFTWELFLKRAGMSLERTVVELCAEFQCDLDADRVAAAQRRFFQEEESAIQPIHEVVEFARKLAGQAPLAVASGSQRATVHTTLQHLGIFDIFDVIVTPEDVEKGKPYPDMFLLAAKILKTRPEDCLVLEDAELGFEAARRAGMAFARVGPPEHS